MSSETIPLENIEVDGERTFDIHGIQTRHTFDIGVTPANSKDETISDLPDSAYDTLKAHVISELDADTLRDATTEQRWPKIGTCKLQPNEDGTVTMTVVLSTEWMDE